jgi:hypothetical protein
MKTNQEIIEVIETLESLSAWSIQEATDEQRPIFTYISDMLNKAIEKLNKQLI